MGVNFVDGPPSLYYDRQKPARDANASISFLGYTYDCTIDIGICGDTTIDLGDYCGNHDNIYGNLGCGETWFVVENLGDPYGIIETYYIN